VGGKSANKFVPKYLDTDWIRISLHTVNAITKTLTNVLYPYLV